MDIGGSSGISTIALAAAARQTGGSVVTIEIEPSRQAEAKDTLQSLGLSKFVTFHLASAADVLLECQDVDFALIDCEKEDYIRFFDLLRLSPKAIVVADNILSHGLDDYVAHIRKRTRESITFPIGKGLEVSRMP